MAEEWTGEWVCVTHARFTPCEGGKNRLSGVSCVMSSAPASVEAVRRYLKGEQDAGESTGMAAEGD